MSLQQLSFALLGVAFWILTLLSVDGLGLNGSAQNESYYIIPSNHSLDTCNLTNIDNPPSGPLRGTIRAWPEEYSKFSSSSSSSSSWIAYVNCDEPNNTESSIFTAHNNNSIAVVLYSNSSKSCNNTPSNNVSVPLFIEADTSCQKNIYSYETETQFVTIREELADSNQNNSFNSTLPGSTPPGSGSTPPGSGSTSSGSDDPVIAATYQTAMVILYSVSGIVLGLFFVIVIVNLIRNRFRPPSQSTGGGHGNPRNGITKSVLDSFPVYLFSLGGGVNKVSENAKDGDVSGEPVLESLKVVVDEKKLESTEEAEILDQAPLENKEKDIDAVADKPSDDAANPRIEDSSQNRSAISSVFNKVTDEQLTCPICLGDFESGEELRILPCHHQYHTVCIDPWLLDASPLCPMCKTDYTSWDKELPSLHHEDGIANDEQSQSQIDGNDSSSQHIFPHFRWIKYLTAIRRASGRRRHSRRARLRHSETGGGEISGHRRPQDNDDEDRATTEQGVRHGIFRASI